MPPDPEAELLPAQAAPFADLLFSLVACLFPLILLLAPGASIKPLGAEPPPPAQIMVQGSAATPLVAAADGLRFGSETVLRDTIPGDRRLILFLEMQRAEGRPLLFLIEPAGQDSAFLAEPMLAAHGPREMLQVRLDGVCGHFNPGPALAACRGSRLVLP